VTILARDAVVAAAQAAGFPADQLDTAAAIAKAESAWNTLATGYNPGPPASTDYGLWQINSLAHPDILGTHDWRDPAQNAQMAYSVWLAAGRRWTPWSTFTSGSYLKFLTGAPPPDATVLPKPVDGSPVPLTPVATQGTLYEYHGEQLPMIRGVKLAGPSAMNLNLILFRDGQGVPLVAGDSFWVVLSTFGTPDPLSVYAAGAWRLLATGNAVLSLDEGYISPKGTPTEARWQNPPALWTPLATVNVNSVTPVLTATKLPAAELTHQHVWVDGYMALRVTVVSGSVNIDWVTLQLEPPAGLDAISTGWSSEWITPAEILSGTPLLRQDIGQNLSSEQDGLDLAARVAEAQVLVISYINGTVRDLRPIDPLLEAHMNAQAGPGGGVNRSFAVVGLSTTEARQVWAWDGLEAVRRVPAVPPDGSVAQQFDLPYYQYEDAPTVPLRWQPSSVYYTVTATQTDFYGVITTPASDGAVFAINVNGPAVQVSDTPQTGSYPFTAPNGDVYFSATTDYLTGALIGPPSGGWVGNFFAQASIRRGISAGFPLMQQVLQLPNFRWRVWLWSPSSDSLRFVRFDTHLTGPSQNITGTPGEVRVEFSRPHA